MDTGSRFGKAHGNMITFFETVELALYGAVGLLLIVVALISLFGELGTISSYLANNTPILANNTPILGLKELFATIIALELLMTVVGYMKTKSINLGLLIGAGLTAMIRKIITVGYEPLAFQDFVLVLLATVILVAAIVFVGDKTIHT
jgi:uncharacterized membrane protein (DUF373 family)